MVSATDLRRMAKKLRALGADQVEPTRKALTAMADQYESDAEGLVAKRGKATGVPSMRKPGRIN